MTRRYLSNVGWLFLALSGIATAQTSNQALPLQVTNVFGITSTSVIDCAVDVIDNRSTISRSNTYHSFLVNGSGVWTVTMNYSDSSCAGPWTSFGSQSSLSNGSSQPWIGWGYGYHSWIQVLVTGSATASYAGTKNLYYPNAAGGTAGFTWAGTWSSATTYLVNNVVFYGNSSWIAVAGSTNVTPGTNFAIWQQFASGGVTTVNTGCGITGGPLLNVGTLAESSVPNVMTGTSYTFQNSDCGTLISQSNNLPSSFTLPQAGSGGNFALGWCVQFQNTGTGTATITPTISTIDGVSSLTRTTGEGAKICSSGTNYFTLQGGGGSGIPASASSQLTYLRVQPNTGNLTTYQFASLPTISAPDYNFSAMSCSSLLVCAPSGSSGGSLAPGNNVLTFAPVPQGVNGSDLSGTHGIWVSGGTGTAEAGTITGGSGTEGQASGQIILNVANAHSGAFTLSPIAGGLQEAICSVPPSGGDVLIPGGSTLTLLSNVTSCGKGYLRVTLGAGAVVSGAYTIMGAAPSTNQGQQIMQNVPNYSTLDTLWNGTQFDIGGFPLDLQVGFGLNPNVQALVGSVNPPNTVQSTPYQIISGVSGYANSYNSSENSVGLYGQCYGFGAGSSCWGLNVEANHVSGIGGGIVGIEADVEEATAAGQGASLVFGVSSVADFVTPLVAGGTSYAFAGQSVSNYPFTYTFGSLPGTASIGLYLGAAAASGISQSQIMQLLGNDGINNHVGWQFVDSSGNWWLQDNKSDSTGADAIYLDPAGLGSASLTVGTTEILSGVPVSLSLGATYQCTHGANGTCGVATLNGTTGVTVSTTAIAALAASGAAGDTVTLQYQGGTGANTGVLYVSNVTPAASFVIKSTNASDANTVYWEIRVIN